MEQRFIQRLDELAEVFTSGRKAAAALGCGPSTFRDWRAGKTKPGARHLQMARDRLGLTPAQLLGDEPLPADFRERHAPAKKRIWVSYSQADKMKDLLAGMKNAVRRMDKLPDETKPLPGADFDDIRKDLEAYISELDARVGEILRSSSSGDSASARSSRSRPRRAEARPKPPRA